MKTIWIDRTLHTIPNNWGGSSPRNANHYYDYTVHVVPEGGEMTAENATHSISGRDHRDAATLARVEEFAMKIAAVGDNVPIKKAWEEGIIHYAVTMTVNLTACSPDEAEARFRHLFNVNNRNARVTVQEG